MVLQRFAGDVFHYQERNSSLVDPHVIELHNGRIGKLPDDLGFAEEFLLLAFAEAVDKGLESDDAADHVVAGHFNPAASARAKRLEAFVAAFLQGDHQAERRRRAARVRRPLLWLEDCGEAWGTVFRRAKG